MHSPSARDFRAIEATCAILDLLPRHVAHQVDIEVLVLSTGDLCAVAGVRRIRRRTDYPQGVLSADEFPVFAARHIEAFAVPRLKRAA